MKGKNFERLFSTDIISKRERVELTLNLQPVDRVALCEQLSFNPGVISSVTGKPIDGFNYTIEDIYSVIRKSTDLVMPAVAPRGTARYTNDDGFVFKNDNWTTWHISRPFNDEIGARDWLRKRILKIKTLKCDPENLWLICGKDGSDIKSEVSLMDLRKWYREFMIQTQKNIGDTLLLGFSFTGFCSVFDAMGLEIFTFFCYSYPEVFQEFMEISSDIEVSRIHAVADAKLSPVILIPEDFSHKSGPIFGPDILEVYHYPFIRKLTQAWHEHGIKVIYHSDGNYKSVLPQLMNCGVDGFYCLEKNAGMDIVELKNSFPNMIWAGGVDGVELMERGNVGQIKAEVHRHIEETDALNTGGMFIGTSSEVTPPIPPENYKAMFEACGEVLNKKFIV